MFSLNPSQAIPRYPSQRPIGLIATIPLDAPASYQRRMETAYLTHLMNNNGIARRKEEAWSGIVHNRLNGWMDGNNNNNNKKSDERNGRKLLKNQNIFESI